MLLLVLPALPPSPSFLPQTVTAHQQSIFRVASAMLVRQQSLVVLLAQMQVTVQLAMLPLLCSLRLVVLATLLNIRLQTSAICVLKLSLTALLAVMQLRALHVLQP